MENRIMKIGDKVLFDDQKQFPFPLVCTIKGIGDKIVVIDEDGDLWETTKKFLKVFD